MASYDLPLEEVEREREYNYSSPSWISELKS